MRITFSVIPMLLPEFMTIGLTYDLRQQYLKEGFTEEETAEFDKEDTIIAIEEAIQHLGHRTVRIGHIRQLTQRLAMGERWDLVFNICEGLFGIGREAQVPALLDAYQIPYTFSDPMVLSLTLHKAMTKRVVRDAGIQTPDFFLVEKPGDVRKVPLSFPLFVKPNAEGTGKGIDAASKVDDFAGLEKTCRWLLPKYKQGLIVESYLPGREFTVGITGTGEASISLGVMEIIFNKHAEAHGYSYLNKEDYEKRVSYRIIKDDLANLCSEVALTAWRTLTCRDAGRVDLRLDPLGNPGFIEVNPLAGLNPVHSDLPILCRLQDIPYSELIHRILASALKRIA